METTRFYGVCCVSKSGIHHRNWIAGGVGADERLFHRMDGTDEGLPSSRSACRGRRYNLVHGADGERLRTAQSTDGSLPRVPDKDPGFGPHGLAADQEGNIWFTGNFAGYIGKLDPKTGAVTEYRLADEARDPHTPVFDQIGNLWFTVQGADMIGRLVPKTGDIKLVHVPTANALPYGIAVNSNGVPFFAEFGTNKLASIDPKTMEIHEYPLPDAGSRPRRIAITSDGAVWYTDYARGYLGQFDPQTNTVREWRSPSGPNSGPYGIANLGDVIWYSESGVKPNTLVRFDPRTEKFELWTIPSGGGVVRNMATTSDGKLVLACSGVDRIALVDVRQHE